MDLSELKVPAGTNMQIELVGSEGERFASRLIGFVVGKTVQIITPQVNGRPILVRKDQEVIVRFFANKVACAFRSKVVHLCTTPYFYLHLRYPSRVEVGEVRKSARALAKLPVSIMNQTQTDRDAVRGVIVDISTTGARLETVQPIAQVGDNIMMSGKIEIGSIKRLVSWDAVVRAELQKFTMDDSTAAYGIEFNYLPDVEYLALFSYVNYQLVRGFESM